MPKIKKSKFHGKLMRFTQLKIKVEFSWLNLVSREKKFVMLAKKIVTLRGNIFKSFTRKNLNPSP